jgi:hypothetical protein
MRWKSHPPPGKRAMILSPAGERKGDLGNGFGRAASASARRSENLQLERPEREKSRTRSVLARPVPARKHGGVTQAETNSAEDCGSPFGSPCCSRLIRS